MPIQPVVIDEFKDIARPGSTWRLNWFGAIERDPDVATEYKLQVILTLVKDSTLGSWHLEAAVDQDCLRMARVGVGQLPLLRIGSLWKDGELIRLKTGETKVFRLDIPAGPPTFYSPTDKVGQASLIPFRDHRLMGYGKNTRCLTLNHGGDPAGIIVPAIELIRFYYANSTRLAKAVFNGEFVHAPSNIYDPEYTGLDGKLAVVCRRQHFSNNDCWSIARILNSPVAFDCVRRVNDSMIRDFSNTGRANPESSFPFSGPTQLTALCKKVGYAPARWLVLSLVSCSAPFPYDDLLVIADNDNRQADPETDLPEKDKIPINRPSNSTNATSPIHLQSGTEPNKQNLPMRLELADSCFTALEGKVIKQLTKNQCKYASGQLRADAAPPSTTNGTADGDYVNPNVGKIELTSLKAEAIPPSYQLFVDLIRELNKWNGVTATPISLNDGLGLIKVKRKRPAGKRQLAYINHRTRELRHLMLVEIVVADNHYYIVEIQRRPKPASDKYCTEIFYSSDGKQLSENQIDQIITTLSSQEGRINDIGPLLRAGIRMRATGLKHTKATLHEYADKILSGLMTASAR